MSNKNTTEESTLLEAAAFRRLLAHLDSRKDVQNIELMNLAGFCRNCLSKWYKAEADANNIELTDEQAREAIYGMPYSEWKQRYQKPATEEQLATMQRIQEQKQAQQQQEQ
ncbi:MAG: DUF1244 domain-containing protein [Cellvibrionaceae bacterium]